MVDVTWELSRRRLLAGVGAAGGGLGATSLLTGQSRGYSHYTYVGTGSNDGVGQGESRIRVAWWESYNGDIVETQDPAVDNATAALDPETEPVYVSDVQGPIIQATNVLPGDEGRLGIGIQAQLPAEEQLSLWYRLRILSRAENGLNEPERAAGDVPGNGPELGEYTAVTVWEDTNPISACTGEQLPLIDNAVAGGKGSLTEVSSALSAGQRFPDCLADGETRCLGFRWQLPADRPDINVVQGDSISFSLEFRTAPCEAGDSVNPFQGGESDE